MSDVNAQVAKNQEGVNTKVISCLETAKKGKAFCTRNNCVIPTSVADSLHHSGLIELSVYGGERCKELCQKRCWILPKNVHPDVQEAIVSLG